MTEPPDFPYMLHAVTAWRAPEPPRETACPYAQEGERVLQLRPRSRADFLRAAAPLAAQAEVRCLLLAVPDACDVLPEDLRRWASEAEARLRRPVTLRIAGAPCPCGEHPHCQPRTDTLRREQDLHLSALGLRTQSLAEALAEAFPGLNSRERELLHAWAHRPEPSCPNRPIFQTSLAQAFNVSLRWVERVLARARNDNPALFARLKALRTHRLRKTGAWEVQ